VADGGVQVLAVTAAIFGDGIGVGSVSNVIDAGSNIWNAVAVAVVVGGRIFIIGVQGWVSGGCKVGGKEASVGRSM